MSIKIECPYIAMVSDKEYKAILGLFEISNNKRLDEPFIEFWTHHTKKACKYFLHNSRLFDYLQEYGGLFETQEEVDNILVDLLKQVNAVSPHPESDEHTVRYMNKKYITDPSADRTN